MLLRSHWEHEAGNQNCSFKVSAVGKSSYLVLVLGAVVVVLLQGGEHAALGTRLGARVQQAQLQKVMILCHVFFG